MLDRLIGAIVSLFAIILILDFAFCGCILPMDAPFFEQLADAFGSMILLVGYPNLSSIHEGHRGNDGD